MPVLLRSVLLFCLAAAAHAASKPDCAALADGHYVIGCSSTFYQCKRTERHEHKCPDGMYFDPLRIRCLDKDEVKQCKHPEKYEGEVIKAKEFSCKGKKTGDYAHPAIPCDKYYYACNHDIAYQMLCPPKQYFDERTKSCELKKNVPACLARHRVSGYVDDPLLGNDSEDVSIPGQESVPATGDSDASTSSSVNTPTVSSPYEVATQEEVKQTNGTPSCSGRGDVDSVFSDEHEKCATFYWKCSNDRLFKYNCPNGLYYDPEIKMCVHKQDNPSCGGVRPEFETTSHATPIFDQGIADFDCSQKADGFYSIGACRPHFISCQAGRRIPTSCAQGLFYDESLMACEHMNKCTDETSNEVSSSNTSTHTPGEIEVFDVTTQTSETTSRTSSYGEREEISTTSFTTSTTVSPQNDESSTTTIGATTRSSYDLPPFKPTSSQQPARDTSQINGTDPCSTKMNGVYPKSACSQEYFHCWDQTAIHSNCPSNLVFNPYNGQCDYRSNVVDCEASQDTPQSTTTRTPYTGTAIKCSSTGYFSSGCSAIFYHCLNGYLRKLECPTGTVFNIRENRCDQPASVHACIHSAPVKTMPSSAYHGSVEQSQTGENTPGFDQPTTTPKPIAYKPPKVVPKSEITISTFDCTNKPDGVYAFSTCTKYYAQCFNHKSIVQACAEGLWYNSQSGLCDYKDRVDVCRTSTTASTQEQPSLPPTASTSGNQIQPTNLQPQQQQQIGFQQPVDFSCIGKVDGHYSFGCSSTYYSCLSQITHKMSCPGGLKFAATQQNCEEDAHVAECGGQPRPTQPAQDQPLTETIPLFSCSGLKTNGVFEIEKCHRDYAICNHGIYHLGRCLPMLVFNPTKLLCDFKQNTPTCGSMYVPTAAPTLVPVQHTAPLGSSDCIGKSDGLYPLGSCMSQYLQCRNSIAYYVKCPGTATRFNAAIGICDFATNVPGCIAVTQVTQTQGQAHQSAPAISSSNTQQPAYA